MLIDTDEKRRIEYERYVRAREEEMKSSLKDGKWDLFDVSTAESFITPLVNFLNRREILLR